MVSAIGQPRPHVLTLCKPHGLRDGFFTLTLQDLVGTGSGVQDVDPFSFPLFLPDNDVTMFGSGTLKHDDSFVLAVGAGSAWREDDSPVWISRKGGEGEIIESVKVESKTYLHTH